MLINKMDLINAINNCERIDEKEQERIYIMKLADEIYRNELSKLDDVEFFKLYDNGQLDDIILPYLNYLELMGKVKAVLTTYFDF